MAQVFVSIGSNIDRSRNVRLAIDALKHQFGELLLSTIYESEAVGFDGDNFYNLVAAFETPDDVIKIAEQLRLMEERLGRERNSQRFSSRTMDIDLLLYDDLVYQSDSLTLPRDEILHNAFVLKPLSELIGDRIHPLAQQSYLQLWQAYDAQIQPLWPVTVALQD